MANIKSAAKRARQTVKRTAQNRASASAIKTLTKAFQSAVQAGDKEKAKAAQAKLAGALDKAAGRGRVHGNLAARRKSRMAKKLAAVK